MSNTPTGPEVLAGAIGAQFANLRVARPATVLEYDASQQRAVVQPLVLDGGIDGETGARVTRRLPAIVDVPVVFPGSGDFSITWPVRKGDTVLLIFTDHSLDKWLHRGGEVDPLDDRRHDISDAIAIPGLRDFVHPTSETHSSAMVIAADEIRLGSRNATEFLALKADVDHLRTKLNALTCTGGTLNITASPANAMVGTTKVRAE